MRPPLRQSSLMEPDVETHRINIPRDDRGSPFGLYLTPHFEAEPQEMPADLLTELRNRPASDYSFAYTNALNEHGPLGSIVCVAHSASKGVACLAWIDRHYEFPGVTDDVTLLGWTDARDLDAALEELENKLTGTASC